MSKGDGSVSTEVAPDQSDYERYIRTGELLSLQKPVAELLHHDELLFQCTHQASELWMKVAAHELQAVIALLAAGGPLHRAPQLLLRCKLLLGFVGEQMLVLETMAPADYMAIRAGLGQGSGQDSPGFRALVRLAAPLWDALGHLLSRRSLSVDDVVQHPDLHPDVYAVVQGLMDFDESFQRLRYDHLMVVKREIGIEVSSLKGAPVSLLEHGARHTFFPDLWAAVSRLTASNFPG